jgi:putative aldouronate transport system substrate-binding protein
MKISSKRAIIILAVCIMLVTVFAGCNSAKKESKEEELFKRDLKEVTLAMYFPGEQPGDMRMILDEIEKNSKGALNVKLDFQWISERDYLNKMKEKLETGETFDALAVNNVGSFAAWCQGMAQSGVDVNNYLMDITGLFPQNAPEYFKRFSEDEIKDASYNEKTMIIPHYKADSSRMCAIVRADLFKKYDLPDIKNLEDYEVFLQKVKENEKSIIPGNLSCQLVTLFAGANGYVDYDAYLVYKWQDPQIKLIPWEQTPEFSGVVDTLKRWQSNGYLIDRVYLQQGIMDGTLASSITYLDYAQSLAGLIGRSRDIKVFPLNMDQLCQRIPVTNNGIAVNKHAQNADRFISFVEWLHSSQENYDLLMYGISGKHYKVADDRISFLKETAMFSGWSGSDVFFDSTLYRPTISDPDDYKQLFKDGSEANARYPSTNGFIADWKSVQDLYDQRWNSCKEMERDLLSGVYEVSIPDFISSQKAAGADKLMGVMQKQIDDWKSGKK